MYAVIYCLVTLVAVGGIIRAAPTLNDNSQLKVVEESNNYAPEEFSWSYELSDGREVRQNAFWNELPDGTKFLQVNGFYSYVGPDGMKYSVSYYSDQNGYHPDVTVGYKPLVPLAPPAPPGPVSIDSKVLASLIG